MSTGPSHIRLLTGLSLRDLLHERTLVLCSLIGLAAVLAPLIVLFGLKQGVIDGLRAELIDNPRSRMVVNSANRNFDASFLMRLAARPDVTFVIPRLRSLNNEARFEDPARPGTVLRAELLATATGDPLLQGLPSIATNQIIPSASFAARLDLQAGMLVTLRAIRGDASTREVLNLPVIVAAVAPPGAFGRDGVFLDLRTLLLVDGFTDGTLPHTANPVDIMDDPARIYAGFRAHARRLDDVTRIDHDLRRDGVEVETLAEQIEGLLSLDRSLTLLFALLAGLGGVGYLVSLGVGLYANVERKQRDLSLLRLIGLSRRDLVVFPLLQALLISSAGVALASTLALMVAALVNRLPLGGANPAGGRAICVITAEHLLLALLTSLLGAALSAAFAGHRAARIEPAEGLRDA
ncbi:MAG: FtsX-like permease family protein [Acetobacteraceae bacterium]